MTDLLRADFFYRIEEAEGTPKRIPGHNKWFEAAQDVRRPHTIDLTKEKNCQG